VSCAVPRGDAIHSQSDLLSGLERPISHGLARAIGVEHPLDILELGLYMGPLETDRAGQVLTIE
jgi:hypothetical protein